MTDRTTDPYKLLGETLSAAARRHERPGPARWSVRSWLSHRVSAAVVALALALAGGAIAVAATGLLNGSPVPEVGQKPTPDVGNGVPAPGGSHLLSLRVADPEGGPPWGMRVVHTTRGSTCVQMGRVQNGQLGQLGIDGAYHDDGRFHPLPSDILPIDDGHANISCILPGQTLMSRSPTQDRSAEWMVEPRKVKPTARELRSITYGLLGPHAVSITYRTATGTQTRPVSPGSGAYMIVEPVSLPVGKIGIGGDLIGWVSGHEVSPDIPNLERFGGLITVTYRFGSLVCAVGSLPSGTKRCAAPPPLSENARNPTRSLHEPVRVTAVVQSHKSCSKAFLLDPCYLARVEFKAPYTVVSAAGEYQVEAKSTCHNARPNGWTDVNNVKRGETLRTLSTGYFNCVSTDEFEVRYINRYLEGSSVRAPHKSVIVGIGILGKASHRHRYGGRVVVRRADRTNTTEQTPPHR
jgi:hypothetical protein